MSDSPINSSDATSRFFYNYLSCLQKASIPEKQRRWYMKRVEDFIKSQKGRKIKTLSGNEISQYFETIGHQNRLSGWQFYQCIDAIRILYCDLLICSPCQAVDWQFWKDSATQLDIDLPTTAHHLTPEELSYLKERRGEGPINKIRASHRGLLVRFTSEIRR